ncbi:MAG: type II toxin-antitoxin system RelE/ParE family toxin [Lautropia sp.]
MAEVAEAIDRAAVDPLRFPVVSNDVRRTVLRRFPYCIYYRLRSRQIVVLAVFHARRDPKAWQRRI